MPAYWTWLDYSREKSTFRIATPEISDANFVGYNIERQALFVAMTALSLGTLNRNGYGNEVIGVNTPPTSPVAQRENKWLITYEGDTSGKTFQVELPVADLADGHLVANSDEADVTHADWVAFISAFNSFARTPDDDTETVTFLRARFVGRNL